MSKWPESAVAVALILLIAAVSVTGIARYSVEEFLKIWAALTGLVGIITGAVVTYFFARTSLDNAERKLEDTQRKLETVERERTRALLGELPVRHFDDRVVQDSKKDDVMKNWIGDSDKRLA